MILLLILLGVFGKEPELAVDTIVVNNIYSPESNAIISKQIVFMNEKGISEGYAFRDKNVIFIDTRCKKIYVNRVVIKYKNLYYRDTYYDLDTVNRKGGKVRFRFQ